MIKVLQIGAENFGNGGRSVIAFNLVKNMPLEIRNDFLAYSEYKKNAITEQILSHGQIHQFLSQQRPQTLELLKQEKYDIVHIHADNAYEAIRSAILARKAHVKVVVIHAHVSGGVQYSFAKRVAIKISQKLLPHFSTKFIACTNAASTFMYGRHPRKAVTIIKDGIDVQAYAFNKATRVAKRTELGLTPYFVIGNVGRLAYQKNQELLIDAFSLATKQNNRLRLLLIGEGNDRKKLTDLSQKLGVADKVFFLGNRSDIPDLLSAIDLFAFPSRYEGFGMAALEAQAAGLPTLISETVPRDAFVTSFAEALPLTVNEWANKINQYSKKERNREEQALIATDQVKQAGFDIINSATELEKIYRRLVNGH